MSGKHKFPPEHAAVLDDAGRRRLLPPEEILQAMDLAEGETLVDVGCGTGFFALPAARMVGESGQVYALDTSTTMLAKLQDKLASVDAHGNIKALVSQESALPLPDGCADAALLAIVLHEADDAVTLLREIHRCLIPGGRLGLVEWHKTDTWQPGAGPPPGERLSPEKAASLITSAGFQLERQWDPGPLHYCLLFSRP